MLSLLWTQGCQLLGSFDKYALCSMLRAAIYWKVRQALCDDVRCWWYSVARLVSETLLFALLRSKFQRRSCDQYSLPEHHVSPHTCVMPFCWCLEPYNLRTAAAGCAGTVVKAGQAMVVLSAMKMETAVAAPCDGVVRHMAVAKGDTVDAGRDVLAQQTWAFVLPLLLE